MSKIIALKCPSCTANVYIEEGKHTAYCSSCGTQIIIDDGNKTITHKTVDEARIKEAEVSEKIRLSELEAQKKNASFIRAKTIIAIIISIVLASIGLVLLIFGDSWANSKMTGYTILVSALIPTALLTNNKKG